MADQTKISPNGTPYLITNWIDEIAYQLICVQQSAFGAVKNTIADTLDTVVSPITSELKSVTSALIPVIIVAVLGIGVYFFIISKKK